MKISCFMSSISATETAQTVANLRETGLIENIFTFGNSKLEKITDNVSHIFADSFTSSFVMNEIANLSTTSYTLICNCKSKIKLGPNSLYRMLQVAEDTQCAMVYSNYFAIKNGKSEAIATIDYQEGSLRDDFNFGSLILVRTDLIKKIAPTILPHLKYAGLYALRLALARKGEIIRIPEHLYTEAEIDNRKSGEKIFDYVDPRNRAVQIEMEEAVTEHLKAIGGWLKPEFKSVGLTTEHFDIEASVIIPVRNRAKTIEDAIKSVLSQKTTFQFNLIVVDNYSTDGTTELIAKYAKLDNRLIHIIPEREDLGIGGCWNEAANNKHCGKFAVQLDSDDIYLDETTLQQVVDAFYGQNCAMVIGSYKMVNFALEEIPPGIIDHKEWTPENGRNNALRINGLGAPRAFFTPILRANPLPNVNYGEDYALGLAISRSYQIGRIYTPIYLCRRWDENSDAALSVEVTNGHNLYKDRIRTIELKARINLNKGCKS